VLDLGLAIIQGEVPADRTIVGGSGYVVGTMDYLAPEQAEDALKVDQRADIYSLGCTLYFALTGRPPFPGGNALQKIMRHYSEEPTPLHTLNPNVPAEFAHLVNRMMAKRPNDRFDSAERVARALKPWESGEPVRPMDERGDVNYQHAVAEIQSFQVQVTPDWVWQEVVESPPSATGLIITNKRTVRLERLRPSMPALPTLPTPQSQGLAAWFDRILPAALVILFLIGCLFVLVH
jgi:serine/threonine protein kinase